MEPFLQNESTVSGTLGRVLRISQIFGMASVRFEKVRDGWRIRVSRAASFYGRTLILLLCVLACISLGWDISLDREISIHSNTVSTTVLSAASVGLTSAALLTEVYFGMDRMHRLVSFLAFLQKVNLELNIYGPSRSFERKNGLITVYTLIFAAVIGIEHYGLILYDVIVKDGDYLKEGLYFAYYVETFILKVLIVQVFLILRAVLSSFYHINDCLENLLKQIHIQGTIDTFPKSAPPKIRRLGLLYCNLCDVMRQTNDALGLMLMLIIVTFLLHLIMAQYIFFSKISGNTMDFYKSVSQVLWALYYVLDLIMIVEPCHQTYVQMDRTKHLISLLRHLTQPTNHVFITELEIFYKHLVYNKIYYEPMKIFTLDRGLITTMFGSIITYLVIIIDH